MRGDSCLSPDSGVSLLSFTPRIVFGVWCPFASTPGRGRKGEI